MNPKSMKRWFAASLEGVSKKLAKSSPPFQKKCQNKLPGGTLKWYQNPSNFSIFSSLERHQEERKSDFTAPSGWGPPLFDQKS